LRRGSANPASTRAPARGRPPDRNPWIHIPIGYGKLFIDKTVNWRYESEPQKELDGRRIMQPRGPRARRLLLDQRPHLHPRPEGGLRPLAPARQCRLELGRPSALFQARRESDARPDDLHGVGGPLKVSDQRSTHELCDAFIAAAEEAGLKRNDDFNGPSQEGAGYYQTTMHNGRRWSTARGYLRPARKRANLVVETNALATRVLFEGRRAIGVEYRQNGAVRTARASREVILSGGAFNSPQLLQLSGVGPAALLAEHGIALVHDMPGVGSDLQDHLQVRMVFKCPKKCTLNDDLGSLVGKARTGLQYALFRNGPLSVSAGTAGAFFRTDPALATPDIQVHFVMFSTDRMGTGLHPFSAYSASVCQLRPESAARSAFKSA